jgi:uroporphyrinogen decarboxylase
MPPFTPDYNHLVLAARNCEAPRLPLYEHIVCDEMMETVLGRPFSALLAGDYRDKVEYFRNYCAFFQKMGYDTVSFEACIGPIMPGSGALGNHVDPVLKTRADFERYPWEEIPERYFACYSEQFRALGEALPAGMKAVGGVGNGVFECVQELTGYTGLCYLSVDDPALYRQLFATVGEMMLTIWRRFLPEYGESYCVLRFGDDLGYKSNTLLPTQDIVEMIIPQYRRIVDAVHASGKPFLLHSCGKIQGVMDDLIGKARIDAKHSNEDQIAPFPFWVEAYGDRIGNFGGIDTDAVCRLGKEEMREYIRDVIQQCAHHGGFAFGSGNSIPDYVPAEGYLTMVETVRELRGDFAP